MIRVLTEADLERLLQSNEICWAGNIFSAKPECREHGTWANGVPLQWTVTHCMDPGIRESCFCVLVQVSGDKC